MGLADLCARSGTPSAAFRELRALEDTLSLTRPGRLRNRITLPVEEEPGRSVPVRDPRLSGPTRMVVVDEKAAKVAAGHLKAV